MLATVAETYEAWTNTGAHVAQIAAIIVGGWWAWERFIRQREDWPRANLEQVTNHRKLNSQYTFLRVWVKVDNVSTVLLPTTDVRTDIYQVQPLTSEATDAINTGQLIPEGNYEANWPVLGSYQRTGCGEIEPEESDSFGFDFIIPASVQTAFIYSYISNPTKTDLGWAVTSLYDLDSARGRSRQHAERVSAGRRTQ